MRPLDLSFQYLEVLLIFGGLLQLAAAGLIVRL